MKFEYDGYKVEIDIPEEYNKILINVSGGADSSLYLYLLIKYLKEHNRKDTELHLITSVFARKKNSTDVKSSEVVEWIVNELDAYDLIKSHYKYYLWDYDKVVTKKIWWDYYDTGKANLISNCLTSLPKNSTLQVEDANGKLTDMWNNPEGPTADERGNDDSPVWNFGGKNLDKAFYEPFKNVDKKFIANIYKDYGLMDTLFPLTRSCESTDPEKCDDYKSHCGSCWWCLERKWAFGKL